MAKRYLRSFHFEQLGQPVANVYVALAATADGLAASLQVRQVFKVLPVAFAPIQS